MDQCDVSTITSWRKFGKSNDEIATLIGLPVEIVANTRSRGRAIWTPTPSEIAAATAEIRKTWTADVCNDREKALPLPPQEYEAIVARAKAAWGDKYVR